MLYVPNNQINFGKNMSSNNNGFYGSYSQINWKKSPLLNDIEFNSSVVQFNHKVIEPYFSLIEVGMQIQILQKKRLKLVIIQLYLYMNYAMKNNINMLKIFL